MVSDNKGDIVPSVSVNCNSFFMALKIVILYIVSII